MGRKSTLLLKAYALYISKGMIKANDLESLLERNSLLLNPS